MVAVYSGTFDPITIGHIDIIKKALGIFDKLIIAVAVSKNKNPMFSLEKRIEFIKLSTEGLNIEVKPFDTLLVDFLKKENIKFIVRGLRNNKDFEYELNLNYANKSLYPCESVFFISDIDKSYISSSLVREILNFNGDVNHLVDNNIVKYLYKA